MGPNMFIHVQVWIPDFLRSFSSIGSYEFKVSASLDESVDLLSEESLLLSALRKLFEGSSLLGSAIMPDLDASGRKAPVRKRCRISSNCLIGSASKSLLKYCMRMFSGAVMS